MGQKLTDLMVVDVPEGQSGKLKIERFTVTEDQARFDQLRAMVKGHGRWCRPGTYTKLTEGGTFWMSDTMDERYDHLAAVREAERHGGQILINGLGLGMVVQACLSMENVEKVTVVEKNEDVIGLVAPHYEQKFGDRFEIVHADAYEQMRRWPKGSRWNVAWHDIWPDISEDNLTGMARLNRSYARRTNWQGCWAQELCRAQRSRHRGWW